MDRANTTRLRISAHRLEIELGRYSKIPRTDRLCSWCNLVMNAQKVENEEHFLNYCDLNAVARQEVLRKINAMASTSCDGTSTKQTIGLDTNLVKLISDNKDTLTSPTNESQIHLARIISRYITSCFNNRKRFLESTSANPYPIALPEPRATFNNNYSSHAILGELAPSTNIST